MSRRAGQGAEENRPPAAAEEPVSARRPRASSIDHDERTSPAYVTDWNALQDGLGLYTAASAALLGPTARQAATGAEAGN